MQIEWKTLTGNTQILVVSLLVFTWTGHYRRDHNLHFRFILLFGPSSVLLYAHLWIASFKKFWMHLKVCYERHMRYTCFFGSLFTSLVPYCTLTLQMHAFQYIVFCCSISYIVVTPIRNSIWFQNCLTFYEKKMF